MDDLRFQKIIQDLEKQRQTWLICCRPSTDNQNFIRVNRIDAEKVFFINAEAVEENLILELKRKRPDYILVLEADNHLIDETKFIYEWGGKHFLLKEDGYVISRPIRSYVVEVNKKVLFDISMEQIEYQQEYERKVEAYWNYLLDSGKPFYNGDMYSLLQVTEEENCLRFLFGKTNYKHMIYSKEHDFRNDFHTCTTASIAIMETKDGYSVLGKMSEDSAFANQYKCIGGALSNEDIVGTQVDIDYMFRREILEEMGIDIGDHKQCLSNTTRWLLVREKLAFVGLCNIIKLNMTREELQKSFSAFHEQDDEKEVSELLFVKSYDEIQAIEEKEKADYVDELYKCYFGKDKGISWEQYQRMSC